ncbi:I78 family peptidase inhibitor [Pseudooceanicola sp.]|uniref:I78 family peptidase inhibitor n=1 Tax=Pseudooceanicola sp. TaxID=1914328 RepID=UPI00405A0712
MKALVPAGAILVGLTLAACEAPMTPAPAPDDCGAGAMQRFVGQPYDESMIPAGAGPVRVGGPGTAMTMDFRPDRLTIRLDDAGRVVEARCQ